MGMWFSEAVYGTNNLLLNILSHMILVVLAFLGILVCNLSLVEAGVISPNPRYSFYWGLFFNERVRPSYYSSRYSSRAWTSLA